MAKTRRKVETTIVVPLADDGWAPGHLEDSLVSALRQCRGGFRVSVVDASESAEIERLVKDVVPEDLLEYDKAVVRGKNALLPCMYQALSSAKSTWIAYLEPGVVWRRDHLFRLLTAAARGGLDVAFSGDHVTFEDWSEIPARLRRVNEIPLCGAIHSLAAYGKLFHGWRRDQIWSDWDLWLQFVMSGAKFGHDPQATSERRVPRAGVLQALAKGQVVDTDGFFTADDRRRLERWDSYVNSMDR